MAVTEVQVTSVIAGEPPPVRSRAWVRKLQIGAPVGLLALIFVACFILPLVAPIPKATGGDVLESLRPAFSPGHLLGTDDNGNDILARILYGGRTSLFVAFSVTALIKPVVLRSRWLYA